MKTILITGAAGYIGSRLVPFLLKKKYKVRAIDRFFFGKDHIKPNKNLELIKHDVRNTNPKFFENVYGVIDLAALSNDVTGEKFIKETYDINFKSRFRNAKIAKKYDVRRYILPSSASNYGKIKNNQIATEEFILKPLTHYSKANAMAEENILKLKSKNFSVTVLRQGTVYGYSPKMRFDLVINRMTYEAWKNHKILLMKDGTQRRPLLHIEDAINAMKFILEQESNKVNGEIFNVGSDGNNINILDLSEMFKKKFKKKLEIEWYGAKDKRSYFMSFEKIKKLGFKGNFKPIDGISEILELLKTKKIQLDEKTITLDWYENLEKWNKIIQDVSINNKIINL